MSLRGPLRAKKQYLKTVLEPHGILLQTITERTTTENPAYYELIWRTSTLDSSYRVLEEVVEGSLNGVDVRVEPSTIDTSRIARVRGKSVSSVFQHRAIVEFTLRNAQTRLS